MARWRTYEEVAHERGITVAEVERLAYLEHWPKVFFADGVRVLL